MNPTDPSARAASGRPWIGMVLVLLLGMAVANGLLVRYALSGNGNEAIPKAYETALSWNQTQAEWAASAALGWSSEVSFVPGTDGLAAQLILRNKAGEPIENATVTVQIARPGVRTGIEPTPLTAVGGGTYRSAPRALEPGLWELSLRAQVGQALYLQETTLERP